MICVLFSTAVWSLALSTPIQFSLVSADSVFSIEFFVDLCLSRSPFSALFPPPPLPLSFFLNILYSINLHIVVFDLVVGIWGFSFLGFHLIHLNLKYGALVVNSRCFGAWLVCLLRLLLREKPHVEQLIRYIVEEASEDAEKRRTFKFPFVSCEVFTCEVDIILKTLVEDEELMDLLFSFLDPKHSHSTLLAGYFSKVVICLLLRNTISLMHYIQGHQQIISWLVDLIGITSIMEVLVRLIGADEHIYANHTEAMQWLEETDVLEMIVDKFSSSDSPEVHANAAETLCVIIRYAPPGIAAKVSGPSFIRRLFHNALEESRPKSVVVNSLCVCICLIDPKRLNFGTYHGYNRQFTRGSVVTTNPERVEGMLGSLGSLLKLLDISSEDGILPTTYGKLQPPLGKHRLKVVEFVSVLLTTGNEAAEMELMRLGAVLRVLDLFFEYPFNNFLHHHVESIIVSCLESKSTTLVEHVLRECNLVQKILEAEKYPTLPSNPEKVTVAVDGRPPPQIGNIGHLTRISNKLMHLSNMSNEIQASLQENIEWAEWQSDVLSERNTLENICHWACGRPTVLQDQIRDSDDDDYQDRDFDVAALANNLSQAFRYGIYSNEMDEGQGSLERDDEDVYFDDESAEVVLSSLRLGDDQESGSLFTNINWFAFEDERISNDSLTRAFASPSPDIEETGAVSGGDDEVNIGKELLDTGASSRQPDEKCKTEESVAESSYTDVKQPGQNGTDKPPVWVEWRETTNSNNVSVADQSLLPNGALEESWSQVDHISHGTTEPPSSITNMLVDRIEIQCGDTRSTDATLFDSTETQSGGPRPTNGNLGLTFPLLSESIEGAVVTEALTSKDDTKSFKTGRDTRFEVHEKTNEDIDI